MSPRSQTLLSLTLALLLTFNIGDRAAWSQSMDKGSFGRFERSLNTTDYGYQVIADPTGNALLPLVERFEVRPGDCGVNGAWSDCEKDRERSELRAMTRHARPGDEFWYGWSLFVDKDWKNVFPTKTALGQFHQYRAHTVWMFQNHNGGLHLDRQVTGRSQTYVPLIPAEEFRGRWHKIVVHARWSKGADGFFRVWVNGKERASFDGPTMRTDQVYFRYGVYRTFMSRYRRKTGEKHVPAQTALFAGVRRAATRESLGPDFQ